MQLASAILSSRKCHHAFGSSAVHSTSIVWRAATRMRGGDSWRGKGSLKSCWLPSQPNTVDDIVTAFLHCHHQGTSQCTGVQFSVWYVGRLLLCADLCDLMAKIPDKFKIQKVGTFSNPVADEARAR